MTGQRGKYQDAKGNVFNATPEHAKLMNLQPVGEPFVHQSTAADVKQADQVENKMVAGPAENKSAEPPPTELFSFSGPQLEALQAAGFDSADKLEAATDDELLKVDGVGAATVAHYREYLASR